MLQSSFGARSTSEVVAGNACLSANHAEQLPSPEACRSRMNEDSEFTIQVFSFTQKGTLMSQTTTTNGP